MGSIYKITNTVNGKSYIGQTRQDAEKTRIRDHLTGRGNVIIKNAVEKYGKDAFTFEVLHDGVIPEFLDTLEKETIEKFNTISPHGYNLRTGGEGGACSEETKRKISKTLTGYVHSDETRQKLKGRTPWNKGKKVSNPHWLGRKHTDESRHKMSEGGKGRIPWNKGKKGLQTAWNKGKKVSNPHWLGRKHTDESRHKISEGGKGRIPWNKGKQTSEEVCRKISNAKESPECKDARALFFSLPPGMDIKEKRKRLRHRFPHKNPNVILKWCKKFEAEAQRV